MRLLDTNAISMPEKNADNTIVTAILIKRGMSVSTIYKNDLSLFVFYTTVRQYVSAVLPAV